MASKVAATSCAAPWSGCDRGGQVRVQKASDVRLETLPAEKNFGVTIQNNLRASEALSSRKFCGASIHHKLRTLTGTYESRSRDSRVRVRGRSTESVTTETTKKIAKLCVKKTQTVPLPTFSDASGDSRHLSVFLRGPEGQQCMLNTKSLRKYEEVGDGVFKCYLPTMEFLAIQVAPVIDLAVHAKEESCQVNLLSCKFEGSNLIRSQNERFSASLTNHLSWSSSSTQGEQQKHEDQKQDYLHINLELNVALEVYTMPFTMLPVSAVETPGTLILQALVDRLLPVFLEELLADYRAWAETQLSAAKEDQIARVDDRLYELNGSSRD